MTKLASENGSNKANAQGFSAKDAVAAGVRAAVDPSVKAHVVPAPAKVATSGKGAAAGIKKILAEQVDEAVNAVKKHGEDDQAGAVKVSEGESQQLAMVDSASAASVGAIAVDGGQDAGAASSGDDNDGGISTPLIIGGVLLVGGGAALALGGGGGKKNEAPTITSGATATIAENAATTTAVYTAAATDPDGDSLTYTLTGADAGAFDISATGVVTLKASANFEAKPSYAFTVNVSDGKETVTKDVAVTVTNVNEAPAITSAATATVVENTDLTTEVYKVVATDPDASTTLTYSLGGADAALFTIDGATGSVKLKAAADFETKAKYEINVIATDNGNPALSATKAVTVNVTDVNEAPTITSAATAAVAENAVATTEVYKVTATDPDANTTLTYSLSGADAALFTIDGATGSVKLKASADFEAKPQYQINVIATDNANPALSTTKAVTVNVTDVNEAPTVTSGATAAVAENAAVGTVVYDINATDSDANSVLTYSLSGADAGAFNVNPTTGEVTLKVPANYEAKQTYGFDVVATDEGGLTATKSVVLSVTDTVDQLSIDGGSIGTPLNIDARGVAGTDLLDVNYQFNETPALSEVVISHFGQNDFISFSQADAADYDYQAVGDDLVISFNGNGDLSKITLVDVLNNGAVVNSEATAEAALSAKLGATANVGGYLVGSALPETINIAAGNSSLNAAGKAATFVEDGSTESQALIQNFRSDDVIKFINAGNVGDLLFSVSATDENDLRIDYLNANNQLSTIIFDEVLAPNTGIATFEDAAAALGRSDFLTFA